MKIYKFTDSWIDERSYLCAEQDEHNKKLTVSGSVFHHNTEFKFHITQQNTGKDAMRGTLSIISPLDGRIMQVEGKEKAAILENLKTKKSAYLSKMDGKRIPELNISTTVKTSSFEIAKIQKAIVHACLRLYSKHADQIYRTHGMIARPETITPGIAAFKYVDKYIEKNHKKTFRKKSSETQKKNQETQKEPQETQKKTQDKYRNDILSTCLKLPFLPMAKFTVSMLQKHFEKEHVSIKKQELLRNFWEFCRITKVCTGGLPFPPKQKKKPSPEKASLAAARPDTLSLEEQDNLYDLLIIEPNGGDCGVALQLWAGYSAKTACSLTWGKIIWHEECDDYIRIKHFRPDLAGATLNFTAPPFPACARILRKKYLSLRKAYSESKLKTMPIVSQIRDPEKALTPDTLVQHAAMRLHSIGLTYEDFHVLKKNNPDIAISKLLLLNTYKNNVYTCCSLHDEEGTASFLTHEAVSANVTDDHYTCFSDEEAGNRLYTIMSCLTPEETIECELESDVLLSNGRTQYTFTPETTRQRIGVVSQYTLKPNEEIVILCHHGITGTATVRGFNEDGSLRRKSKTQKEHTKKE